MDQFDYLVNEFITKLAIDGFFYGDRDEVVFRSELNEVLTPMLTAMYEAGVKAAMERNG